MLISSSLKVSSRGSRLNSVRHHPGALVHAGSGSTQAARVPTLSPIADGRLFGPHLVGGLIRSSAPPTARRPSDSWNVRPDTDGDLTPNTLLPCTRSVASPGHHLALPNPSMSSGNPLDRSVTAIIATYNRARYIEQAIDSILAQQQPVAQLIVVDDGSVDDTAARIERYGSRITYLRKANGGKSSAINLGLGQARGEWIWIFDDDDLALPNATRTLLDALDASRSADLAFGGKVIAREGSDGQLVGHRELVPTAEPGDGLLLEVLQGFPFLLQAMLIRRRCFDRVGKLDERYLRGQDYELIIRLVRTFQATRVLEPVLLWRDHEGERGPANLKHAAHERDMVWSEFDAMLGREIRAAFNLGEFLVPRVAGRDLSPTDRSAALFNRAVIMATKGLIDAFVEDLGAATSSMWSMGLSSAQKQLLLRTGFNQNFVSRLMSAPAAASDALRSLPHQRAVREALAYLTRAIYYGFRHLPAGDLRRRTLLPCLLRMALLAGPRALAAAYLARPQTSA